MTDVASELEVLKTQMAKLLAAKEEPKNLLSSWVVFDANKIGGWCSKTDCPKLKRDVTYDVVDEVETDEGLEAIIKTGLSAEEAESYDEANKKKRIGSPTIKHHDLGVIAAFTTEKKATDYIARYFKINQRAFEEAKREGKPVPDIGLSEVVIHE